LRVALSFTQTVSNDVSYIFSKLQAADRKQAIIKIREAGVEQVIPSRDFPEFFPVASGQSLFGKVGRSVML
jgi:hypothetical protein